jgi:hypothetical protein
MSDLATTGAAAKAFCSVGLASCLTGNDWFAVIGAVAGLILAITKQEPDGIKRLVATSFSVLILAIGGTWFIAEAIPTVLAKFDMQQMELIRGRMLVAALLAYFMRDRILPGLGDLWDWLVHRRRAE